jgi:hypothetical protein
MATAAPAGSGSMRCCTHSPVFAFVPDESMIKAQQRAYYEALASSDKAGNATSFVTFMLQQLC